MRVQANAGLFALAARAVVSAAGQRFASTVLRFSGVANLVVEARDRWLDATTAERVDAGPKAISTFADAVETLAARLKDVGYPIVSLIEPCPDLDDALAQFADASLVVPPPLVAMWREIFERICCSGMPPEVSAPRALRQRAGRRCDPGTHRPYRCRSSGQELTSGYSSLCAHFGSSARAVRSPSSGQSHVGEIGAAERGPPPHALSSSLPMRRSGSCFVKQYADNLNATRRSRSRRSARLVGAHWGRS
jgi:hypothetical protein